MHKKLDFGDLYLSCSLLKLFLNLFYKQMNGSVLYLFFSDLFWSNV